MVNQLSIYYPLKVFIYSWLFVILIRTFGLMNYVSIKIETYIIIFFFIVAFVAGFFLSLVLFSSKYNNLYKKIENSHIKVNLKYMRILVYISFILSLICVGAMNKKISMLASTYDTDISLEGASQLRGAMLNDNTYELGSNIYGIISSSLFGFPILCGVLLIAYKNVLSFQLKTLLLTGFIGGIISSFMTGGRFMAFTFILFYIYSDIINIKRKKSSKNIKQKIFLIIGVIAFFIISSRIFIDRLSKRDISDVVYLLPLCYPKPNTEKLLDTEPNLMALVIYFEYYIAHGINQLDVIFNAPYPSKAPYLGAYSFKTPVLMLNKLGLKIIQSNEITQDIINPGVYFTEIGALYIDFGYVISIILTFFFSFTFSIMWMKYRATKTIVSYFNCIIFLALTVASPIVSLINSGYFSAILVTAVFVWLYARVFKLPAVGELKVGYNNGLLEK